MENSLNVNRNSINNKFDLDLAIAKLERKQFMLEEDLKNDFHSLLEGLRPTNILKHTVQEIQESTTLRNNLLKVALGLGAGYFSRKLLVGKSAGVVKKILGTALQYGITNLVAKKNASEEPTDHRPKKKSLLGRILAI
jgi:hypothetical protein